MDGSSRARSDPAPVADENGQHVVAHDSLVTVRLSEPPDLHVNTNIEPIDLPSRESLCENDYTPSDAMTESAEEEHDGVGRWQGEEETDVEIQSPTTGLVDHPHSLHDELGEPDSPDDSDSIHSTLDDTDITQQDSNDTSGISQPRTSEETNWDQLQEIEDQESKDTVSENVSPLNLLLLTSEQVRDK